MDKSKAAVMALMDQAQASVTLEIMRGKLDQLIGEDFPTVAALFGKLAAVKRVFVRLWEDVEVVAG